MAGLLDAFGDENARFSLGLLAAAAPRFDGANDGQRIMEALQGVDSWKQKQAQAKMQQMQMDEYNQKLAQQKAAQEAAARKQAALPSILGGTPALAPLMGDADSGILPSAGRPAGPTTIDVRAALAAGYTPEEIQALDKLRTVGLDEVARTVDVEGPGGSKNVQGFDRFGRPVGQGIAGYVAPVSVNQGDRTTFVKPTAGISLPMGMSPRDRDASARGWARYGIDKERLGIDRLKAAVEAQAGPKMTEDQAKATGWLVQAEQAYKNMQDVTRQNPSASETGFNDVLSKVPSFGIGGGVANVLRSSDRLRFMQASSSLSESLLRAATGAGVNKDEAEQKVRELTPQIGDSDAVIKQKADAIPYYIESLRVRAGPGAAKAAAIMGAPRKLPGMNLPADFGTSVDDPLGLFAR